MGRPAYQLTQSDFTFAREYLIRKGHGTTPGGGVARIADPVALQRWCDDYLLPDDWQRLKNAILQDRKRGRDEVHNTKPVTLNISRKAWKELNTLQRNINDLGHQLSYSDLILALAEKYNGKAPQRALKELEL